MRNLKLFIDGQEAIAEDGMTILEAAQKAGIHIPTLCHRNEISPTGVCRICVVEVAGSERLLGACHTPVAEGMVVHTRSSKVLESRKTALELMIAGHTGPCVRDSKLEQCEIHALASELELGPPRFQVKEPRFYPIEEVSPYIRRDLSKCILCRRCVGACDDVAGKHVYGVGYRGFDSKIIVDHDVPLDKEACKGCGVCIDYCPTSALGRPAGWTGYGETKAVPAPKGGKLNAQGGKREKLLGMLKTEQARSGCVSPEAVEEIAQVLGVGLTDAYGVATFYSFLSKRPLGRNVIRICRSLPCYLKNAPMVIDSVKKVLGIKPGETTPDGRFSFRLTNCIGACDKAPAMLVNHDVHGHLTPEKISSILNSYAE
jgi:NADH:ubiquinone oxidoreductase subunit E/Pyruvate/2-oxoacid:ferredoxin oxidoreductase delta subunit